jgi:DNA modification methylase
MPHILQGNAIHLPLGNETIDAVVTSPPYWGLRTYGDDSENEIGRGSFDLYVGEMRVVFYEIKRVLHPEGVFWLNVGDTASGSGGAGGDYTSGNKSGKPLYRQGKAPVNGGQWCGVPWRLAFMAQAMGFYLRHHITWDKGRLRPESLAHVKRHGVGSEPIFMFTKQRSTYNFRPDNLTERGDVWHFAPSKGKQHLAPFPDELPKRCIEACTWPGDYVLDPFNGSGTTARVAEQMGRVGVGVELYADTIAQAASHESDMFTMTEETS